MELAGYKIEGIHKDKFFKAGEESDSVSIACNFKDYIFKKRKKLWDSNEKMLKRYKKLLKS